MVDFVKEKIHARFLVDNKNPNKLKKTAFEKLNETQIEIIRRRVNTNSIYRFPKLDILKYRVFRLKNVKKMAVALKCIIDPMLDCW